MVLSLCKLEELYSSKLTLHVSLCNCEELKAGWCVSVVFHTIAFALWLHLNIRREGFLKCWQCLETVGFGLW